LIVPASVLDLDVGEIGAHHAAAFVGTMRRRSSVLERRSSKKPRQLGGSAETAGQGDVQLLLSIGTRSALVPVV
jgi:hypothetical protein